VFKVAKGEVAEPGVACNAALAMTGAVRADGKRLSLGSTWAYALGAIAFGVKESGLQLFLLLFYGQVLGLPEAWVGTGILLALVLDALLDPWIGQFSDSLSGRWGRRHPLLYAAAVPAAVAYALLWNPPSGLSQVALFGYFVGCLLLVRVLLSFVEIPGAALTAELTQDYHYRTALISRRTLLSWCGGVALNTFTFGVLLADTPGAASGILRDSGYNTYGLLAGALIAASTLLSAWGTHHLITLLKRSRVAPRRSSRFREVVGVLRSPALRIMLLSGVFGAMAGGIVAGLDMYVGVFFWRLSSQQMAAFPMVYLAGVLLSSSLVGPLSRKLGKRSGALAAGIASLVIGPLPVLAALLGLFPARESAAFFPLLLSFCGVAVSLRVTTGVLSVSMLTDIAEEHELRTHQRAEGLLTAAMTLIQKTMSGVGILASGLILSVVHFPRGAEPGSVDAALLSDLVLLYVPLVTALGLVSVLLLSRYPIDRTAHEQTLRLLEGAAAKTAA
jgi:GPH family glycoside/pentoside/hexuronide:cation symporter